MVQIPPPQPNAKGTQMGAFFAFGFESAIRAIPLRVMSHDERSSLGECVCALPVAEEAQTHEWQPSQRATEHRRGKLDAVTATGQANAERL